MVNVHPKLFGMSDAVLHCSLQCPGANLRTWNRSGFFRASKKSSNSMPNKLACLMTSLQLNHDSTNIWVPSETHCKWMMMTSGKSVDCVNLPFIQRIGKYLENMNPPFDNMNPPFLHRINWLKICEDHKTYLIQFGPPHTFANFKRLQSPLWSPVAATSWIDQTKSAKNERHIGSQHHSPFLSHAVQTTQTLRQWTVEISWKLEILAAMCTTWLPTAAHRARSVLFRKMAKKKRRCLISSRSRSTNLAEVWEETDHVKKRRDVPHCAAFMIGKTSQYFGFKSICSWPFSDRDEHSHFRGKSTNQLYAATSGVVLCNAQIDDSMPDCCFRMFYLASGGETGQHFSLFCWRGMGWGVGGWGGLLTFLFKWTLPSCYVNKIFSRTS